MDIIASGDTFVIALPYGTNAQWVRNVLAAGTADLTIEGHTWAADHAELVPTSQVADAFPPSDLRMFRLLGTDRCLRLQRLRELPARAA